MNKTTIFVTFACLAGLALIGSVLVLVAKPDATATFTNTIVLVLGLVVSAAGTFAALGKVNEKLDNVQKQTNGNLSAKDAEIARLQAEITKRDRLAHPSQFDAETGATIVPLKERLDNGQV